MSHTLVSYSSNDGIARSYAVYSCFWISVAAKNADMKIFDLGQVSFLTIILFLKDWFEGVGY